MSIVVTIPVRTVSEANVREHWAKRARRAKAQRTVVHARLRVEFGDVRGRLSGVPWVVTVTRIAPRMIDAHDNLPRSAKACVDGICDALGIDDRDPRVTWRYGQERGGAREYAVRVTVEGDHGNT